jgi:hypothetical protein
MCTHLKNCQRQPEDVREQAYSIVCFTQLDQRPGTRNISLNSPLTQFTGLLPLQTLPNLHPRDVDMNPGASFPYMSQLSAPPVFVPSFPSASGSGMNINASTSTSNLLVVPTPNHYFPGSDCSVLQYIQSPYLRSYSPYSQSNTPMSNLSSASESPVTLLSESLPLRSVSGSPAPLLLDVAHAPHLTTGTRKQARTVSHAHSGVPNASAQISQWSNTTQERFETHLANITASCGFPSHWVENHAV